MIALDSSIIVPALLAAHTRHTECHRAVERVLESDEDALVPVHAMIESYSVLTRLPAPHRVAPDDAVTALQAAFARCRLAPLAARSVWSLLDKLAGAGLGGGLTYDAVILRSAEDAGASALLTLNARHYERLAPRLEIQTP